MFFAHQGFTQGESTWLPINESYKTINVEDQSKDQTSTLQTYKTIVHIRRAHEDLILWGTTSLFIEVRISAYQFAKLEKVGFGENVWTWLYWLSTLDKWYVHLESTNVIRDFIFHLQGSSVLILKRSLGHEVILVCLNFSSSEECISKEDYLSDFEEITILWPARYFISIMDLTFS